MSNQSLMNQMPEGLPFERRREDTEEGWALYLEWVEAPADVMLTKWAQGLSPEKFSIALTEGRLNEWQRRKQAWFRYAAELASCQVAMEAAKTALTVVKEWQDILVDLTSDLDVNSKNYTDARIERLRVVGENIERLLKAATSNKFVVNAVQINAYGRSASTDIPALSAAWNPQVQDLD